MSVTTTTQPRCFRVQAADNVATLLDDTSAGAAMRVLNAGGDVTVTAVEPITAAHKVALVDLPAGAAVVKFGVTIGHATRAIGRGEWVHLHNCASRFDERSQTLDVHSGAVTDTRYE
jgi:hypothetical protein